MQESFEINSASGNYEIVVGSGLLNNIVQAHPDAIFLVDERLKDCLPADSGLKIILLQAVESNKSLEAMPEVILKMREAGANRGSHLVAIGGGIIQDIATFVASVYMRGLAWTYMPTTFLGMVDSCIGGKSSVNVHNYKNLVGNFHPPKSVHIDLNFLKTLSAEMVVGGLYEAAKICYARSYEKFGEYLAEQPQYPLSTEQAHNIILHSLKTKKWFIEIDEFDQKERLLLNYGHTFGHAIEAGTNFGISHGIAVGIGMVVAVEYAKANGQLSAAGTQRAEHLIAHVKALLGKNLEKVIAQPPKIDLALILEKFKNDKKHTSSHYRVVLPDAEGGLALIPQARSAEVEQRILHAYQAGLRNLDYANF